MSSSSRVSSKPPSTWLPMAAICLGSALLGLFFVFSVRAASEIPATARTASSPTQTARSGSPRRIVSLVPSLTETLFLLGLGDRLVGITDFCDHLPEAASIPSIGTCLEPGVEAIAAKNPDLILSGPDQERTAQRLAGLGFKTEVIAQVAITDIPQALARIGDLCGVATEAASLTATFREGLAAVSRLSAGRSRPRVLLVVGRDMSDGVIDQAYVAASGSYHDELLRLAGADNAWNGPTLNVYPMVTREGLLTLDPEVIVDLVPDPERQPGGAEGLLTAWKKVPGLSAAKTGRIHLFTGKHASIPGPRSAVQAAEQLARLLHAADSASAGRESTP